MPRLTDLIIRNARSDEQDRLLADGGCLFLRVRPSGSKGWVVRLKRNGSRRVHTLGAWPDMTLKEARAEAARIVAVERGTARVSMAEAVEQYMELRIRPRYKRVNSAEAYCRAVSMALGTLAINAVRPVDVSRMIADYRRTAPVASMRLLSFTKGLFSWAVGFGYVGRSPCTDLQAKAFGVEEESPSHLSDKEIGGFWNADDLPHRALSRFLLLTGLRIAEAQQAKLAHIDADGWLTIPASVTKNGKPHRVFIAPLARKQFEKDAAPHLFVSVSPTAVQSGLHRWQDRHGIEDRWTPHDLRRSFASRCGDLAVAPHVIARLLNHTIPGFGSLPVYLRSEWLDERKQAVTALAGHVATVLA